jgi:hypothetical protein
MYRFMRVWLGIEVYVEYLSHGHVIMSSEIMDRRFPIRSCICVRGGCICMVGSVALMSLPVTFMNL